MGIYRSLFLEEEWEVISKEDGQTYKAVVNTEGMTVKIPGQEPKKVDPDTFCESKTFKSSPLGQIPAGGYVAQDNHSKKSIQWLEWQSLQRGKYIQHALNEGEYKVSL